jgi:hypothetical protein
MNNISQNLKRFASIQRSLHTVPTSKISCFTCRYYKEVVSATDIFPNDRKKCAKFVNIIFRDKELTNETRLQIIQRTWPGSMRTCVEVRPNIIRREHNSPTFTVFASMFDTLPTHISQ